MTAQLGWDYTIQFISSTDSFASLHKFQNNQIGIHKSEQNRSRLIASHNSKLKTTFHSAIFENPTCPMLEDQIMPAKKRVMSWR